MSTQEYQRFNEDNDCTLPLEDHNQNVNYDTLTNNMDDFIGVDQVLQE